MTQNEYRGFKRDSSATSSIDKRAEGRLCEGEFIRLAKELFDLPGTRWENPVWDVTSWRKNKAETVRWRFVSEENIPFHEGFGDIIKAVAVYRIRVERIDPITVRNTIVTSRSLYEVMRQSNTGTVQSSSWDTLTFSDWRRAEERLAARTASRTSYQHACRLEALAEVLEARGIIAPTAYKHRQGRGRDLNARHLEDRDAAMEKLPPEGAIRALADASRQPHNERDRLLFAITKLLVATGFRISEVLTLPVDCWQTDEQGRPYLLYWPAKNAPLSPKWIPTAAQGLVGEALQTLGELTDAARSRALVLEADPSRVPLETAHQGNDLIGTRELAEVFSMPRTGVPNYLRKLGLVSATSKEMSGTGRAWQFRVDDVEKALAGALPAHRYELKLPTGEAQPLSRCLCVVPKRFFRRGEPLLLTVEPVPWTAVHNFLRSPPDGRRQSVFERYGLLDERGVPWSISSHQFRHWLNTIAHKGGLSELELARWMGRKDPRQNRHYLHLDSRERRERAKDAVRNKEVAGPIAEVYHLSPVDEREAFLDAQVEAAHITPYGMCTHNFATKPCPYHLQCLSGCGSFLRTKGDKREIVAIQKVQRHAKEVLDRAEKATGEGLPEAANWVEHQRRLLEGADRALAVDEAEEIENGERTAVFSDAPSPPEVGESATADRGSQ